MHTRKHFSRPGGVAALLFAFLFALNPVEAQTASGQSGQKKASAPAVAVAPSPLPAALESELSCSGYIEYAPNYNGFEVVGGEQEQEKHNFGIGDFVFISAGAREGVKVGQEFQVVRPRGQFTTKLTRKSGWLGVYTQEIGRLRVTNVKEQMSVAQVMSGCDLILLGDLLRGVPYRVSPPVGDTNDIDRFADPSGKQNGRIVLARDGRELISRSQVVYVDLGTEDNLKEGDRLTVYRPAGTGDISRFRDEEVTPSANYGFESERFRGGKFSIKAQRVQNPNKNGIYGPMVTTPKIERRRPPMPRKIVGEIVVVNVQARTATAVVTRVAQEIHTGDFVEVK
ncbi:MAG TPA: FlgT C-terminal domain-containing protein [Pyrinomonadaceae bacterium]|nr:FlgT C-terminal domain-containing protein [Pyrinomonadaceae bacterium]